MMEKNVKRVDLFYEQTDGNKELEKRLRTAARTGDTDRVQELINLGVDVNAQDNGWTALDWAIKNGYLDIVALLLKNGAYQHNRDANGDIPVSMMCTKPEILKLLDIFSNSKLPTNNTASHNAKARYLTNHLVHTVTDSETHGVISNGCTDELVLKIRIADAADPDFIEIEIPQSDLTYQRLFEVCCQELNVDCNRVVKLRKLPNTMLRKDKDIQRLQNFQEIEVVTNSQKLMQNTNSVSSNIPTVPANGYQSISKKDQTILY